MKKIFTIAFTLLMMFLPINIIAKTQAQNLEDSLKAENIEILFSDYEESDEQVIVYLFRGEGCTHCRDFLMFLNEFAKENGELFKLRSFEVYYNVDNAALKKKVAMYFGDTANGVPYIIVGNKTFYGFSTTDGNKIEETIKAEYANQERFDVFDSMEKPISTSVITTGENKVVQKNRFRSVLAIVILVIIILLSFLLMVSGLMFKKKTSNKEDKKSK